MPKFATRFVERIEVAEGTVALAFERDRRDWSPA